MEDLYFTLLELDDVYGDNKLSIFDKIGTKAEMTDYAILLGNYGLEYFNNKNKSWSYFTQTWNGSNSAYFVDIDGDICSKYLSSKMSGIINYFIINQEEFGVRPVISYSSIINMSLNKRKNDLGIYEIEYGEYPQTIVNADLSTKLESLLIINRLSKTGKEYTSGYYKYFSGKSYSEYEYAGRKYIRILGDYESKYSNGIFDENPKTYWINVEPIIWYVDEERDLAVSKKLLFSGVRLCDNNKYNGYFKKTNMKRFLNGYFSKDIMPSKLNEPKLYLVNFSSEKSKYYPAYDYNDIFRELYTNIELVPEDANYFPDNSLRYHSRILVNKVEYYPYARRRIEVDDTPEYIEYLLELCSLADNKDIYNEYMEKFNRRKEKKEYMERKVDEIVNEQKMKLVIR